MIQTIKIGEKFKHKRDGKIYIAVVGPERATCKNCIFDVAGVSWAKMCASSPNCVQAECVFKPVYRDGVHQ